MSFLQKKEEPVDISKPPSAQTPLITEMAPPWVIYLEGRLGWTEENHDKEIAKDWPKVGLDEYKTVRGSERAWCGLAAFMSLYTSGLKGPKKAAAASSWDDLKSWANDWSEPCGYICGAFLPLRHASGGRHITVFLYWIDEKNRIAACIGGNQNNGYRITAYNLSGNKHGHDEVVGTPRWPKGYPQKIYNYPHVKSDGAGSTR